MYLGHGLKMCIFLDSVLGLFCYFFTNKFSPFLGIIAIKVTRSDIWYLVRAAQLLLPFYAGSFETLHVLLFID